MVVSARLLRRVTPPDSHRGPGGRRLEAAVRVVARVCVCVCVRESAGLWGVGRESAGVCGVGIDRGVRTPCFFMTSAAIGTVELTGLEMMFT